MAIRLIAASCLSARDLSGPAAVRFRRQPTLLSGRPGSGAISALLQPFAAKTLIVMRISESIPAMTRSQMETSLGRGPANPQIYLSPWLKLPLSLYTASVECWPEAICARAVSTLARRNASYSRACR